MTRVSLATMKLLSIVLVCLALTCCEAHSIRTRRSLDGSKAYPGQFPFLAFLRVHGVVFDDFGTGSLISSRFVLTSKHVIDRSIGDIEVILGANDWTTDEPGQIRFTVHRDDCIVYNNAETALPSELALIPLPTEVEFTEHIQPIVLSTETEALHADEFAIVLGWADRELPLTDEPIDTIHYTEIRVEDAENVEGIEDASYLMVANRRVASWWEIGAPLIQVSRQGIVQIGVFSFWQSLDGTANIRDVYQRVAFEEYLEWIQDNTDLELVKHL